MSQRLSKAFLAIAIAIVLALALALWQWLLHRDHFHAVIPGEVYRSAQLSGNEFRAVIDEHGIETIVNLRPVEPTARWYREERAAVARAGAEHVDVGMLQSAPTYDRVLDLYEVLQTAERPVLMHCLSGVDRSGLGAAMALLSDGEASVADAARQVGWRYQAFRPDSIGKPFLAQYREWLQAEGERHSPLAFERWLKSAYVDPTGNIHFLVHAIGGESWLKPLGEYAEGKRFHVYRGDADSLELDGWAYDSKARTPLAGVRVLLDGEPMEQAQYGLPTPWLEDEFGTADYNQVGWAASEPLAEIADGCHDLSFRFLRRNGTAWQSPPAGRICIE